MAKKPEFPKRLSESDFKYFQGRVLYWAFRLGQVDWQLEIEWCKPEDEGNEMAGCRYNGDNKRATITLNRVWNHEPVTPKALDRYACHEVLHLLFADVIDFANEHCPKGVDANRLEHSLIRTLENILFDK
jgi:hypothetical protein